MHQLIPFHKKTPQRLGYHMPAEWEKHEATWLSWPHNTETWPDKNHLIPAVYINFIKVLHENERVHINVNDQAMEEEVKSLLTKSNTNLSQITIHQFATNDCWIRDYGPLFVTTKKGNLATIDWKFNMWGGKYPPWDHDNAIPQKITEYLQLNSFEPPMILEGGSIEVNGQGTLITTESCLLNKNRNPKFSREDIEQYLKNYLGVTHILWLGNGIVGDDTDGHIDDLVRFIDPNTVVCVVEEDPRDDNFEPLQENIIRLREMLDQDGTPLQVIPLPMPGPVLHQGNRVPASYANFYIANNVVIVPTFNDLHDPKALEILQKAFPHRKVVGLDARDLICGLGAFHCITQQQPSV